MGNNKERKVFLKDLPKKKGIGANNNKEIVDWGNSIGKKVKFIYDGNQDEVEIIGYDNNYIKFIYGGRKFEMFSGNFTECRFGKLFSKLIKDTNPELQEEWDKGENDKLGIKFEEVTTGNGRSVNWICKKDFRHKWKATIYNRISGQGCPYCVGKKVLKGYNDLFTTQPKLENEWNWEKNNELNIYPYELSCGSNKKVWWKCEKGHEWEAVISHRTNGSGCPYCSNQKVLKGYNDIATTHPRLVKYFVNKEEAYKYTVKSSKKVLMKCTDCGEIKMMRISSLSTQGFGCANCGDGVSCPEKTVREILKELNIEFIKELNAKHRDWIIDNKKYDFYFELNNEEYVIETHGLQHYERGFSTCGGRTIEEEQENDKFKKELALSNGIKEENYIILDCRNSELEWIKNSILNSRLNDIFDLSGIDWLKIEEKATRNIVKEACEFYEKNKDIMTQRDISKEFDIEENTLISYIKKGNKIGWCNYSVKDKTRKIICLNFNKRFNSLSEASKEYGLKGCSNITYACQSKRKSAGKHPQTNEPLHWMYLDEFEALPIQEQEELLTKYRSKEETLHKSKE